MASGKDEYDSIFDNDDYSELDENEDVEDAIDRLRGNISSGDCIYCHAKNGMKYEGNICFVCSECGKSTHEDIYYRWAAGYDVEFDD